MGFPLESVLAGIFMVELEMIIIPTVKDNISHWRRYVDDTFLDVLLIQRGNKIETTVYIKSTNSDI